MSVTKGKPNARTRIYCGAVDGQLLEERPTDWRKFGKVSSSICFGILTVFFEQVGAAVFITKYFLRRGLLVLRLIPNLDNSFSWPNRPFSLP